MWSRTPDVKWSYFQGITTAFWVITRQMGTLILRQCMLRYPGLSISRVVWSLTSSLGPVSLTNFCPQFKFNGTFALLQFRCWPSDLNQFFTCHDSTAVVPCTEFRRDHCIRIEMRVKRHFYQIWIAMKKPLVKRAQGVCWIQWFGLFLVAMSLWIWCRMTWRWLSAKLQ